MPCASDSAIHSEGLLFAGRYARHTRLVTSRSVLIARAWSPNLRSGRDITGIAYRGAPSYRRSHEPYQQQPPQQFKFNSLQEDRMRS